MSEPIIFISNQRIKEGKLDAYTQYYREVADMTEATKPGTVAHLAYASQDGTEASIVHIFPDAESMEVHMHGVGELARKGFESMEVVSFEIYGRAPDSVVEMMQQAGGGHIPLSVKPQQLGGYIRLKSG